MQRREGVESQNLKSCSIKRDVAGRSTSSQSFEIVNQSLKLTINGWKSFLGFK
jgi:hypothetical protein